MNSKLLAVFTTITLLASNIVPSISIAKEIEVKNNLTSESMYAKSNKVIASALTEDHFKKLKIKLVKKQKDGSETFLINGKTITVSKKQIQQSHQAYIQSQPKNGTTVQFVPLVTGATLAGVVAYLQAYASVYGLTAALFIGKACHVRPDNCAKTLMGAYQGAGWARNQVLEWSRGRY